MHFHQFNSEIKCQQLFPMFVIITCTCYIVSFNNALPFYDNTFLDPLAGLDDAGYLDKSMSIPAPRGYHYELLGQYLYDNPWRLYSNIKAYGNNGGKRNRKNRRRRNGRRKSAKGKGNGNSPQDDNRPTTDASDATTSPDSTTPDATPSTPEPTDTTPTDTTPTDTTPTDTTPTDTAPTETTQPAKRKFPFIPYVPRLSKRDFPTAPDYGTMRTVTEGSKTFEDTAVMAVTVAAAANPRVYTKGDNYGITVTDI